MTGSSVSLAPQPDRLTADWQVLCESIGERRAGTRGEARAADFIQKRFEEAGLHRVHQESFPCTSLKGVSVQVSIRGGRRWRRVESRALVGAPSTRAGRVVEGDIAWIEMPEGAHRLSPGCLKGRICALFGPLPTNLGHHKRLLSAEPLAVIHVDERLPFPWAKNDGVYPIWSRRYGIPPTVTVPYTEAWRWRRDGLSRARVKVRVTQAEAESQNVVGEIPGSDPSAPVILMGAHHDTQCNNPGADDNASGVVCLTELARLLGGLALRRTVRLVSFGTEEQLSVGSAAYVRRHRKKLDEIGVVINFDSISSPLGHTTLCRAGSPSVTRTFVAALAVRGVDVETTDDVVPFADHFPFSVFGIPSVWFGRSNFPGGRWQHHSAHDTLENVSVDEVVRLLGAVAPLVADLAQQSRWPFRRGLPAAQREITRRYARDLYGFRGV